MPDSTAFRQWQTRMLVLGFALLTVAAAKMPLAFRGIDGCDFCSGRQQKTFQKMCCPSRQDDCAFPCRQSKCYCDAFCDRQTPTDGGDCCPDFFGTCTAAPPPFKDKGCREHMQEGERTQDNCNQCTCGQDGKLRCDTEVCMIQEKLIERINHGRHSWLAGNHSAFWGKPLATGRVLRTGTTDPYQRGILYSKVQDDRPLPENFDARNYHDATRDMRGKIHDPVDQGECASSWAVASASMASDRYSIFSNNRNVEFSPQQLLDCVDSDMTNLVPLPGVGDGCLGGQIDRAWYYLGKFGGVTEQCYPYTSGRSSHTGTCQTPKDERMRHKLNINCPAGVKKEVHKASPLYPVRNDTLSIKLEIRKNGPVQAIFKVYEDFFMYKTGVYQHTGSSSDKFTYHSVKIIGWGVDRTYHVDVPYWLCMNSWGPNWGERGLFKILSGQNHCEIEQYVKASWGPQDVSEDKKHKRLLYRHRIKKF